MKNQSDKAAVKNLSNMTTKQLLSQIESHKDQSKKFILESGARQVNYVIEDLPYDVFMDMQQHFKGKICKESASGNRLFSMIYAHENEGCEVVFYSIPLRLKTTVEVLTD